MSSPESHVRSSENSDLLRIDSAAFQAIFESAAIGIAIIAPDGKLLEINPCLRQMLGYTTEELRTLTIPAVSHPDDMAADERLFAKLTSGEIRSYSLEKRYFRKDGSIMWGRLTVSSVPGDTKGQKGLVVAMVEDATRKKEAEREIDSRNARLNMALDVGGAIAWDWNLKTGALYCHGELAAFPNGTPHRAEHWHDRIDWSDRQAFDEAVAKALAEKTGYELDYRILGSTGEIHWLHTKAQVAVDDRGEPVYIVGVTSDVTRQRDTDRRLEDAANEIRKSSERVRLALKTANAASWEWDISSNILMWDENSKRLFGRPMVNIGIEDWRNIIHPEDVGRVWSAITTAIEYRSEFEAEYRVIWPNGSTHWIIGRGRAIYDSSGKALRMAGINIDITERKDTEQELRATTERFRRAQAAANVGAYDWNLVSGQITWSAEVPTLRSVAPDGRFESWRNALVEEDLPLLQSFVDRMLDSTAEQQSEFRIYDAQGNIRWIYVTGRAYRDDRGKPVNASGVVIDITDRKIAAEEVRRNQKQLRLVIDAIPSLIAYIDQDERFRFANKAYQLWMGEHVAVEGRTVREILGEEAHNAVRPFREAALKGRTVEYEQLVHFRFAGDRYVHSIYIPDIDDKGIVRGYVAFVSDLTERRRSEDQLRRTEKLAATGRLAATIAHEINNPLEAVTNLLYLVKTDQGLSESGRQFLSQAEQELSRVAHITRQTLGFYRDSVGPIRISIQEVIEDVLQLYSKKLILHRVEITRDYRGDSIITALAGEIRQVFSNLIGNAVDAMQNGGRLILKTRTYSSNGHGGIRIMVADSGVGISRQNMMQVFEPFFTTKRELGTGLGLWLSRNIVQKHGGTIRVKSRTLPGNSGTVFIITLPFEYSARLEDTA
ncbi:MAG TPA: PAS domain S-box protein [Terriglobales bacterium]|nr:PAS domain S-box protein [Terriglobales bacterium]